VGKKKRKARKNRSPAPQSTGDAFAGGLGTLLEAQGFQASKTAVQEHGSAVDEQPGAAQPSETVVARAQRWIVRISKKGRGGREATMLSPRGLPDGEDLALLARRIRRELGCGASPEADGILVQGDQRDRIERWLSANGARKVTQG